MRGSLTRRRASRMGRVDVQGLNKGVCVEGGLRNVTPRAKRDDEGHLQESLNFPLGGGQKGENNHPALTPGPSFPCPLMP